MLSNCAFWISYSFILGILLSPLSTQNLVSFWKFMDHPLSADAEEVIFPCRASKQLRDEMEEAWDLLRYLSVSTFFFIQVFFSIDRITFKSAFEAGAAAQKSGKFSGSVTKTKCEKKLPVKTFKTPMKPKQCPPGPPVTTQHQGNKVSLA